MLKTWVTCSNGLFYNGTVLEKEDYCIVFEDEKDPQVFIRKSQGMVHQDYYTRVHELLSSMFDYTIIRRHREDGHKTLFPVAGELVAARGYDFRLKSPIPVPDLFKYKTEKPTGECIILP